MYKECTFTKRIFKKAQLYICENHGNKGKVFFFHFPEMSQEEQEIFTELITNAKQLTAERKIKEALDLYRQALQMHYHEKLAKKIAKMEVCVGQT